MASVSTPSEIERPKWSGLQKASPLTLPFAILGALGLWLFIFATIYDAYIVSFGQGSYFDYVSAVRFTDAMRYTWSIIHTRNTVGLSVLAFALSSPFLFFVLSLWMLKAGKALSRKILYLLHVRSMFSLIALTALIFAAAYGGVIIYGIAFYMVATKAGSTPRSPAITATILPPCIRPLSGPRTRPAAVTSPRARPSLRRWLVLPLQVPWLAFRSEPRSRSVSG
ncbi:hypothetical protein N7E02_03910 (plasmid) [Aliirhizobium terrae]|uniref:hypothetical protein n=1 Tax=Terrirhizobium terrae TaxID=2926709 RepID=UPI0025791A23|nr:hypothetical protein [Rhizobium sp. CC-CFT758]WJH38562.1 hypothetical protein N7E02_03910 [Rhizobium sp. CC-CFT758]